MIKEIYGNYNFWSWLKYYFLDGINKQSIIMLDKTRVIYHKDKDWKKKRKIEEASKKSKITDEELLEQNRRAGYKIMSHARMAQFIRKELQTQK